MSTGGNMNPQPLYKVCEEKGCLGVAAILTERRVKNELVDKVIYVCELCGVESLEDRLIPAGSDATVILSAVT